MLGGYQLGVYVPLKALFLVCALYLSVIVTQLFVYSVVHVFKQLPVSVIKVAEEQTDHPLK